MPYPQTSPEFGHRLSPDGRWIAYTSFRQGFPEVEVRPFPELEPEYKVSAQGGMEALWSLRGDKLLYRIGNQWLASDVVTEPRFSASRPRQLFKTAFIDTFDGASWDLAPDGRFLMIKPIADDSEPTELRIVLNWFEELKRLVPTD
jgi:Tol biopolymer transport system component